MGVSPIELGAHQNEKWHEGSKREPSSIGERNERAVDNGGERGNEKITFEKHPINLTAGKQGVAFVRFREYSSSLGRKQM